MANTQGMSVKSLVLWPAVITLAVTALRLAGELLGGPELLFGRAAGGGGALVGIAWLVPVFGVVFGHQLVRRGFAPTGALRVAGWGLLSLVAFVAVSMLVFSSKAGPQVQLGGAALGAALAGWIVFRGWPELGKVLVAYGLAARLPVAVLMLPAILGHWGTHYDAPPPDFPAMSDFLRWVWTGAIPQLTVWMGFTLVVGTLFASIGVGWAKRTAAGSGTA